MAPFIFQWCIIDFTEKGYVTRLRIADIILSEPVRPDDSRFSDHTFDKTILTVFDPDKTAPSDLYYLYINEDRTLLRFRLRDQTSLKLMPGERYIGHGFLSARPLLNADHLGLSDTNHASFIEELASVKSPLLSEYRASSFTSAPSDNAWPTDKINLTVTPSYAQD